MGDGSGEEGGVCRCVWMVEAGEVWVNRFAYDWWYPRVEVLWYDLPAVVR